MAQNEEKTELPSDYKKQKAKNIDVAVWTVKNKEDYERVKGCADMYIFENEETIR